MVVRGETESVSSGSTTAAVGMKAGWLMVFFSFPQLMTETLVTSLPVPAVVGISTIFSGQAGNSASPR